MSYLLLHRPPQTPFPCGTIALGAAVAHSTLQWLQGGKRNSHEGAQVPHGRGAGAEGSPAMTLRLSGACCCALAP